MPITRITPLSSISDYLAKETEKREKALIRILKYVGEACINEAKHNGDYIDQTGNLRSSIGYVVVKSGSIIYSGGFEKVKKGGKGQSEGKALSKELVDSKGIVLIVVAGMNYAAYVETNRNVISSAELLAENLVPQMLRQLGFKVS